MTTEQTGNTSRSNGRQQAEATAGAEPISPPTDLELMMFFDGELDEPRRSEVERALHDPRAGATDLPERGERGERGDGGDRGDRGRDPLNKLLGLAAIATSVRLEAEAKTAGFSILDELMAALPEAPDARAEAAESPALTEPTELTELTELTERVHELHPPFAKKPAAAAANDNSKNIFRLALAAVAAAAGLMIYSRMEPAPVASRAPEAAQVAEPSSLAARAAPSEQARPPAEEPSKTAPDDEVAAADDESGVVVAAVDFGSKSGSVWQAGASTVVWIADMPGDEQ